MAQCKECCTIFHACGGCGLQDWEWEFCSQRCREAYREKKLIELSEKYNLPIKQIESLLDDAYYITLS